jgi:hypothetical protein
VSEKAQKVLVCGGRDYTNRDEVYRVLDAYHARLGPFMMVISGGAPGADTFAREWAVDRKVDHLILHAKWDLHGKPAGPIRNRRMASKKPRFVLAFHPDLEKSRGTKDMVNYARKQGIKTKVFK